MRFYLSTFMIVMLLVGTLIAVVVRWEPWYLDAKIYTDEALYVDARRQWILYSPDGRRRLSMEHSGKPLASFQITIIDALTNDPLCELTNPVPLVAFLSDDVLVCSDPFNVDNNRLFHRRHPEWWWGHFYRPEVWASIALFFSLVIHLVRARKQRNAGH